MELDDLKAAWHTLEKNLAINERLLRETMLGKTRRALAPYVILRALESVLGILAIALAVRVLVAHPAEPRYWLVGAPVAVFAIAMTAACVHLLGRATGIDYRGAVGGMQRDLARLEVAGYHATKWAVLGGTLLWLPVLLVVFEGLTGTPVIARVDLAWLVANLAFGLGVLIIGRHLANRLEGRLAGLMSGRSLRRAREYLSDLAEFQNG